MAHAQNGWPVVGISSITDHAVLGVEFPNGWLKGDVDVIFTDLIKQLDQIEPIRKGACWGYFVKKIEGSDSYSNHAAGCAIDYNADKHPMGKRGTFSASDTKAIRGLLKRYDGVIRWGGDYKGRADEMHFEIVGNKAAVARVAAEIRGDMAGQPNSDQPLNWHNPTVLAVNWWFAEAYRAMVGKATGSSVEDRNARNARLYLLTLVAGGANVAENDSV